MNADKTHTLVGSGEGGGGVGGHCELIGVGTAALPSIHLLEMK